MRTSEKTGGVFRVTDGLQSKYGQQRVIDTPLTELGIVGMAIGMAVYGLKPVPEIQFQDFIYTAMDQIINQMAKMRYRTAGKITVPLVLRTPYGGGIRGGLYHSQSGESYFVHTAGLKKRRAFPGPHMIHSLLCNLVHFNHVVAVCLEARHSIGFRLFPYLRFCLLFNWK